MAAIEAGPALQALRGLIEVHTRALDEDLPGALQEVVVHLARVLNVQAVAINLHRPAWDDFEVAAIHGPPEVVEALRGGHVPRSTVERLLDPVFDVGGAFFIPAGSIDDAELEGVSAVVHREDRPDHPDRWEEDDELVIPIRSVEGELMGFVAADEPNSGIRPGPREIAVAVAVADAAAAAVRGAQRALEARSGREALELLFDVSTSVASTTDIDDVLRQCAEGIQRALGFERVVIEVAAPGSDELERQASAGWSGNPPRGNLNLGEISALFDPAREVEGCYLWPPDEAVERVGEQARRYSSQLNGRGPLAWDHHWLVVPLADGEGRVAGWVWADDPADRLLPTPAKLKILRTFANQAGAAITDRAHVDQLEDLARLDGLTGVLNQRAFMAQLDSELVRAQDAGERLTLVLFDLDQFKALNDDHGHPAGDAALRSFARILERNVRAADFVGRVGGDEFALLLSGTDRGSTAAILDRVASTAADRPPGPGVRASYGCATAPDDGWTSDGLVQAADRRLYAHKRRHPGGPDHISLVEDV